MFDDLRRAERALFSMDEREIAEVYGRYGWEVVGPSPFWSHLVPMFTLHELSCCMPATNNHL